MKRIIVMIITLIALMSSCQQQRGQGQGGQGRQLVVPVPTESAPASTGQEGSLSSPAPEGKEAWIALGNSQMDAARYTEAIVAYRKALDLDPNNVDVRVDMGTCYRNLGQPEKAIEEYRRALKINPRHPNANRNSGVVLAYDLHRNAEAIQAFKKYLEVLPGAPDADQILADIQRLKSAK
jgi:tetratricopeptide (TPR) repeat protein